MRFRILVSTYKKASKSDVSLSRASSACLPINPLYKHKHESRKNIMYQLPKKPNESVRSSAYEIFDSYQTGKAPVLSNALIMKK